MEIGGALAEHLSIFTVMLIFVFSGLIALMIFDAVKMANLSENINNAMDTLTKYAFFAFAFFVIVTIARLGGGSFYQLLIRIRKK